MKWRSTLAMCLMLALVVCAAAASACVARCASMAGTSGANSCHAGAMPGMSGMDLHVAVQAAPGACAEHAVAETEAITAAPSAVAMTPCEVVLTPADLSSQLQITGAVHGVGSPGRLLIPLRV